MYKYTYIYKTFFNVYPEPPVNGNWSAWTPWSDCTAKCNGGIQTRRRSCSNPLPQRGGQSCAGNINEWRMCNSYTCKGKLDIKNFLKIIKPQIM